MSKYIATIQLHSASETDYENLNREIEKEPALLKKKNLSVKADKSKKGQYNYWGNINVSDVAKAVYKAIRKTGRDYSFTVMKNKENLYTGNN